MFPFHKENNKIDATMHSQTQTTNQTKKKTIRKYIAIHNSPNSQNNGEELFLLSDINRPMYSFYTYLEEIGEENVGAFERLHINEAELEAIKFHLMSIFSNNQTSIKINDIPAMRIPFYKNGEECECVYEFVGYNRDIIFDAIATERPENGSTKNNLAEALQGRLYCIIHYMDNGVYKTKELMPDGKNPIFQSDYNNQSMHQRH